MSLTNTAIKNLKTKEKSYKITDGKGMYFLVSQMVESILGLITVYMANAELLRLVFILIAL